MSDSTSDLMNATEKIAELEVLVAGLTASLEDTTASIDLFFVLVMGIICFLLQAGFGLLEVGSIRAKNAQNIMLKNLMDAAVAAIAYYLFGYSIAYGTGGNAFIGGTSHIALQSSNLAGADYIYWYFNYVFAGTTATIVSGAVAERCQFRAYLVYSFALAAFIYPVASHWIWDPSGFLNGKVYDFAGGGAVHMLGGVAAATGAFFLGPRKGKFVIDPTTGKKVPIVIPGHNMVLASLGALILWFGFFAFNGGSSYTIAGEAQYIATGRAVVVTTMGGATGAFTLMIWGYLSSKTWDVSWVINGLLAGMVATCSGANAIDPWAAMIVGVLGAVGCQLQITLFENYLFIDDPLNASAVHFGAGAVGMMFVAFFANPEYTGGDNFTGIFYGGNFEFFGFQLYGMVVYTAWAGVLSSIMFFGMSKIGWLRVDEEEEYEGMDKSHHGGKAYPADDEHLVSDRGASSVETSEGKASSKVDVDSEEIEG